MSPAEAHYLYQHGPAKHARTARLINLILRLGERPCTGRTGCDEGKACPRHERRVEVAERYLRMKERSR